MSTLDTTPSFYDDLVWACSNLCDLLECENEALRQHDMMAVREMSDNKVSLAKYYEQAMTALNDDPDLAQSLTEDQNQDLVAWGEALKELVQTNMMLLKVEIEAGRYLMDAVVETARTQAPPAVHYSPEGQVDQKTSGEGSALTFNKVL